MVLTATSHKRLALRLSFVEVRPDLRRMVTLLVMLLAVFHSRAAFAQAKPGLETGGHTARVSGLFQIQTGPLSGQLVSVSYDRSVRTWSLDPMTADHPALKVYSYVPIGKDERGNFTCAALRPGNTPWLAVGEWGSRDASPVLLIDPEDGAIKERLSGCRGQVTAVAFSPDGNLLAACFSDERGSSVVLYDCTAPHPTPKYLLKDDKTRVVQCLAFHPDGWLVAGGADTQSDTAWAWVPTVKDSDVYRHTPHDPTPLKAVDMGNRDKQDKQVLVCLTTITCLKNRDIAAGDEAGNILIWKIEGFPSFFPTNKSKVLGIALSPFRDELDVALDGDIFTDGKVLQFSQAGVPGGEYDQHHAPVTALTYCSDGRIASGDAFGGIRVWDPKQPGDAGAAFQGIGLPGWAIAWSQDGNSVTWSTGPRRPMSAAFDLSKMGAVSIPVNLADQANKDGFTLREDGKRLQRIDASGKPVGDPIIPNDQEFNKKILDPLNHDRAFVSRDREVLEYDLSKPGPPTVVRSFVGSDGLLLGLAVSPDHRYLAGTSLDQIVRIWSLKDQHDNAQPVQPLISIFSSDAQWVAWNEQSGYYAASDRADDLICWRQIDDPDLPAKVRTAYQCQSLFLKPEMMQQVFREGQAPSLPASSLKELLARAPEIKAVVPLDEHGRPLPSGSTGSDSYRASMPTIGFHIELATPDPDHSGTYRILDDTSGRAAHRAPAAGGGGSRDLQGQVLHLNKNTIRIVAEKDHIQSSPFTVRISCDQPDQQRGILYVLAVGVNKYPNAAQYFEELSYAVNDAKSIAQAFDKHRGNLFADVDIEVLTDELATRDAITSKLNQMVQKLQEADTLVLFMAGHGTEGNGDFYFGASGFDPQNMPGTGVSYSKDLLPDLTKNSRGSKVLLLDDCQSGGASHLVENLWHSLNAQNIVVFAAAGATESSYEDSRWRDADGNGHGAFTWELLKCLNGEVPEVFDPNNIVRLGALSTWVTREVYKAVDNLKHSRQYPQFIATGIPGLPLVQITAR